MSCIIEYRCLGLSPCRCVDKCFPPKLLFLGVRCHRSLVLFARSQRSQAAQVCKGTLDCQAPADQIPGCWKGGYSCGRTVQNGSQGQPTLSILPTLPCR